MNDEIENFNAMSIKIMEAISNSSEKIVKHCPSAMMRVFVYLAKKNGWSLEKIQSEASFGLKYYYENDPIN